MKKASILLIALMVISVGLLSGCNEQSGDGNDALGEENDDDNFLHKAEIIVDDLYPIPYYTHSEFYSMGRKATDYRLEIVEYTLSPECEEIRDRLDSALDDLNWICDFIKTELDRTGFLYEEYEGLFSAYRLSINQQFGIVREDIEELKK